MIINTDSLKFCKEYDKWVKNFDDEMAVKERITQAIKYFLVYDIEDKKYKSVSDYKINYNQIVLKSCQIPAKKDVKSENVMQEHEY